MRLPPSWRALRIEGNWIKGQMMIGDASNAIMQIKWYRPGSRKFDPARWVAARIKDPSTADEGPKLVDFVQTAWQHQADDDKALWYGYAPRADLALGILTNCAISERLTRQAISRVLPSVEVSDASAPTRWAVFDASFETPGGFFITKQRLHLGDLILEFHANDGARLLVRQVYPSQLALQRRKMERWIEVPPFKEHRKFKHTGQVEPWQVDALGRWLCGFRRRGRKKLPFPLGFCSPRWSVAAIVHDEEMERLLIAEYDSPRENDENPLTEAIAQMNWAQLGPGGLR